MFFRYESTTGARAESADSTAQSVYWGMKACVKEIYGFRRWIT